MYIYQIFSWFHLGTRNWHEHVGDGCDRGVPNWIPDWEPAQESCEACAVYYIWKVSEKKWFPSHHSHLVVFSQWSQAHIIALANSTIFFLTSNADLQLEVIEKLYVCQYNSSQGTLKRPEVPRDGKAFCPNSTGRTACTCPLPPLPRTGRTKPLQIRSKFCWGREFLSLKGIRYFYKVTAHLDLSPVWLLFLKVNCINSPLCGRVEFFFPFFSTKAAQLYAKLTLFWTSFAFFTSNLTYIKFCLIPPQLGEKSRYM